MASPEPSAGAASQTAAVAVQPIQLPTHEEMKAQDMHNNCVIRSVLSGVMGNVSSNSISFAQLLLVLRREATVLTGKL
jgi:hypothetical protein